MLIVIVAGWLVGWILLWRVPRLDPTSADPDARPLSVVIPMRNEADRIGRLLTSLEAQRRPANQIIVVDDASLDGSPSVVRRHRGVELVSAPAVPPGWTGKSWACAVGAARAEGEVLVFLDADVALGIDALARLSGTVAERGGLVSVQPHHRIESAREMFSLPFNVVAIMGLGIASLIRPRVQWGAAGPCLATSRIDYDRAGGHRAVAGAVAEDLALAAAYRRVDSPVHCVGGGQQVTFRMYRTGRELLRGWSKNIVTGATLTPLLRRLGIALWVTALASMLVVLGESAVGSAPGWFGGLAYVAGVAQVGVLGRRVGTFGPAAFAWPLLLVVFCVIFLWSAVQTLVLHRVSWSGRTIPLRPDRSMPLPIPAPPVSDPDKWTSP